MDHERKDIEEQEGLSEEESILDSAKPQKKSKKRHPLRWFFFLTLLAAAALYLQQWYLDLEAEALVYARQTASAIPSATSQAEEQELAATQTSTAIPATATQDPNFMVTQTVAAQLTEVAEFQQTPTAE
jgi:hypothetical protein